MGRYSTGAIHTRQCINLPIGHFTSYLKKGQKVSATISWEGGAGIAVVLTPTELGGTMKLEYSKTDREGQKHQISYVVNIVNRPANIGQGRVYHFLCPFSNQLCKKLYMAYGSLYFKSRQAYQHRIYYASQMSSRLDKHNDAYWRLERGMEALYKQHPKKHYRGKLTAARERIERLQEKKAYHDEMRWKILPAALMKQMAATGAANVMDLY